MHTEIDTCACEILAPQQSHLFKGLNSKEKMGRNVSGVNGRGDMEGLLSSLCMFQHLVERGERRDEVCMFEYFLTSIQIL